ncbi:hypothetical protein D3C87_182230 [compost metagenome]
MKQEEEISLELKSEPMNALLSDPPKWIVGSGSGMLLLVLFVILLLTWFIKYPDEVSGDITVTTSKAPIELSNQNYVQLKSLNVTEKQEVKRGDLIAQFDIQARSEDIFRAQTYLNDLENLDDRFPNQIPEFKRRLQLGTFQEQWARFLSLVREWNTLHAENAPAKELCFIQQEIAFREQLQRITNRKIRLSEADYHLIEEQLAGSERLAEQHAISKQTLVQEKRSQTQSMQAIEGQKEQHVQNLITLNSLRKEKLRLENQARTEEFQKMAEIRISITALRSGFLNWEKNTLWIAPCSGKILFNKMLQVNRFYKANEASIILVPKGSGYQAIASVVSTGAGKLAVGQKAFIELIDYPKTEFGMLEGKVISMTQIDKEGKYEVKIRLKNQLQTTYNKLIPAKAQLKGKVKIITKEKRLLARFFEKLTDLVK